jgi:hypothetical protein
MRWIGGLYYDTHAEDILFFSERAADGEPRCIFISGVTKTRADAPCNYSWLSDSDYQIPHSSIE